MHTSVSYFELSCVKARPSDPLVYVWILWFFVIVLVIRTFDAHHLSLLLCIQFSFFEIYLDKVKIYRTYVLVSWAFYERNHLYVIHNSSFFYAARGVRKVTTGITGLWQWSVQSDTAFWFFDVGSSYPTLAYGSKGMFVHQSKGNVSWV